jgi:hypothetical protein
MKPWMVLVPLLYLPAMIWFVRSRERHKPQVQMLLVYTITIVLGLTFLNGSRLGSTSFTSFRFMMRFSRRGY